VRLPEAATEITEADDVDLFLRVLDEALDALTGANIPFLFIGGIGSAVYGRDQGTRDIDVFVRPETSRKVLDVLGRRGFETRDVYEHWLSKAATSCWARRCSNAHARSRSAGAWSRSPRPRTSW
jgi:hypothetical protein